MSNNNTQTNAHSMTESERNAKIAQVEKQRLAVVAKIEETMAKIAKLSGNKKLARRKGRVGKAANDYKTK